MSNLRFIFMALALVFIAGCAEMRVDGDAQVFQISKTGIMLRWGTGLLALAAGIVMVYQAIFPTRRPLIRFLSIQRGGMFKHREAMGVTGLAALVYFVLAIVKPVFSTSDMYIKVFPTHVELVSVREEIKNPTTIQFSDLKALERMQVVTGRSRRGRDRTTNYMVFKRLSGTEVQYEMGAIENKAYQTILDSLAEYHAKHPPVIPSPSVVAANRASGSAGQTSTPVSSGLGGKPPFFPVPATSRPITVGYSQLKPDTKLKSGQPLMVVATTGLEHLKVVLDNEDGTIACARVLDPDKVYKIARADLLIPTRDMIAAEMPPVDKQRMQAGWVEPPTRFPITIPIPPSGVPMNRTSFVEVGMKLGACRDGKWHVVTILEVYPRGVLSCRWENYSQEVMNLHLDDLVIPRSQIRVFGVPGRNEQRRVDTIGSVVSNASLYSPDREYRLGRNPVTLPLMVGYSIVKPDDQLKPGMFLLACFQKRWKPVSVVALHDDGTVICSWDDTYGSIQRMMREDLVIADALLR